MYRDFRCPPADFFRAHKCADIRRVEQNPAGFKVNDQLWREPRQRGLVLPGNAAPSGCQRHDAVKRAGIEIMKSQTLRNQLGNGALAGGGGAIDGYYRD